LKRSLFNPPKVAVRFAHQLRLSTSKNKLIATSILLSMLGDGSYMAFLFEVLSNKDTFQLWLADYKYLGAIDQLLSMGPSGIEMLQKKMLNIFWLMALAIVATNFYNYYRFAKGSSKAASFMKQLGVLGALFGFVTIFEAWDQSLFWFGTMIMLVPLYLFVFVCALATDEVPLKN
jgi:hypothetical protein